MADLSIQMVNTIEGNRSWVSDKTLVALSKALGIEVFQLFAPLKESSKPKKSPLPSHLLLKIRQDIKADINTDLDKHFKKIIDINMEDN